MVFEEESFKENKTPLSSTDMLLELAGFLFAKLLLPVRFSTTLLPSTTISSAVDFSCMRRKRGYTPISSQRLCERGEATTTDLEAFVRSFFCILKGKRIATSSLFIYGWNSNLSKVIGENGMKDTKETFAPRYQTKDTKLQLLTL